MSTLFSVANLCVDALVGHLWHRHRKRLLHGVAFALKAGETIAYLGPNGAGKTTTFRALCGLSRWTQADLRWRGKPVTANEMRRYIGFLPEEAYLPPQLTAREFLTGLGRLSGLRGRELTARIRSWGERLGFAAILDRPLRSCSKGQRQRILLAQALIREPPLLFLDEPMSGLDPLGRKCVQDVLMRACRQGTAILFSSHILADAEHLCRRVVALDAGHVIFDGRIEELLSASKEWYIQLRASMTPLKKLQGVRIEREIDGSLMLRGQESSAPLQRVLKNIVHSPDVEIIHVARERPRLEDAFIHLLGKARGHGD